MLIEFRVRNFRSFRDEQVLSLVASLDHSLEEKAIATETVGKERLLRVGALYGANASGKSNIVQAVEFVKDFVVDSENRKLGDNIPVQPFALRDSADEIPSDFEIMFIHCGVRYQYGLSLDFRRIRHEWLTAYPKSLPQRWFERKWDVDTEVYTWHFSSRLAGEKRRLESLARSDVSFLSVAAQFNQKQLRVVYDWFDDYLEVIPRDRSYKTSAGLTSRLSAKNVSLHKQVEELLQFADLGIRGFSVQENAETVEMLFARMSDKTRSLFNVDQFRSILGDGVSYDVQMQHSAKEGGTATVTLPLDAESVGTQRLFALSAALLSALDQGSTLIIDELDDSLHPSLVRAIVEMFNGERNTKNAQLVFNTHDVTLLDTSLLRRDQIWFVEKDVEGASHLYPLLEYRPRKDEALAKGYLQGRYGAIPFLGSQIEEFFEDAKE